MNRGTSNADWQTRIGKIQLADCGGPPPPTATPTETGVPPTETPTPTPTSTGVPPTETPTTTPTSTGVPPTETPTPTETSTPIPGGSMHVGDLDGSSSGSRRWGATVTITVHDGDHNPATEAAVSGTWDYRNTSASCTTNSSGQCSVTLNFIRPSMSSVTFTVNNVTHSSLTYSAAANHDPDGDSNGTSITVAK